MNIRTLLSAAAVTLAVAAASQSVQAAIVTNGDFATGDFTGWTLSGDTSFDTVSHVNAPPGELGAPTGNAADLGTLGGVGHLSQSITTVAGQLYTLTFALQADDFTAAPDFFTTLIDGAAVTALSIADVGASDWATFTANFVGTGSDTLDFADSNDPSFFELTDISVDPVPEPSTLALMIAGVVGIGFGRRRRSVAAAHA